MVPENMQESVKSRDSDVSRAFQMMATTYNVLYLTHHRITAQRTWEQVRHPYIYSLLVCNYQNQQVNVHTYLYT